jgi:hypothetical protein
VISTVIRFDDIKPITFGIKQNQKFNMESELQASIGSSKTDEIKDQNIVPDHKSSDVSEEISSKDIKDEISSPEPVINQKPDIKKRKKSKKVQKDKGK